MAHMSDEKAPKTTAKKAASVYQTIVAPKPETLQYLTDWKRPKHAYILFETKEWHIKHDGERVLGTGLMTLNAESRAEIAHHVEIYLGKGFRILDFGNFPKFNDPNPQRAAKALHYSQGAGINPWDSLEKFVKQKMSSEIGWENERVSMENELNVLRQKLAQEQAKKAVRDSVASQTASQVKPTQN